MRSDHCWSHGRGRPSASFQAGSCTARARRFFDSVTRQHLDEDAIDIVLGLRLGEAQRVDLHAVAEHAVLGVFHAVALERDLVPELGEGAHLAHLGDELQARIDEERDAADDVAEVIRLDWSPEAFTASSTASRLRARTPIPAPASRRLPADGTSTRWSGSTSALAMTEKTIVSLISRSEGSGGNT